MSNGCPTCLPLHGLRLPHTAQPRVASLVVFDQSDPLFAVLQSHDHPNMIVDVFPLRGLTPLGDVHVYGVMLPAVVIEHLVRFMVVVPLDVTAEHCRCAGHHLLLYFGRSSKYLVPLLGFYNALTTRLLCHCGCSCTCHAFAQVAGISSTGMFSLVCVVYYHISRVVTPCAPYTLEMTCQIAESVHVCTYMPLCHCSWVVIPPIHLIN